MVADFYQKGEGTMILSKKTIREYMATGQIAIEPFSESQLNPNSYDVSLGSYFYAVINEGGERVYYGPKRFAVGDKVPMPYGVGILGMTHEHISTHGDLVAQLRAKSTTGREFWTVCQDAGLGDIEYCNNWTAEFSSHLKGVVYLTVGQLFGQIVFHATTPADEAYSGQYATADWPECMVPKKHRGNVRPWNEYRLLAAAWVAS